MIIEYQYYYFCFLNDVKITMYFGNLDYFLNKSFFTKTDNGHINTHYLKNLSYMCRHLFTSFSKDYQFPGFVLRIKCWIFIIIQIDILCIVCLIITPSILILTLVIQSMYCIEFMFIFFISFYPLSNNLA